VKAFENWFDDEMKCVINNSMIIYVHLEKLKSGMENLCSEFQDKINDIFGKEGGGRTMLNYFVIQEAVIVLCRKKTLHNE